MEEMGVVKKSTHQGEGEEGETVEREGLLLFALHITDGVFKVRMRGAHTVLSPGWWLLF